MLVYNITTKVGHAILNEWLKWQKEIYIPEMMKTKLFYEHRFYQLLEHDDEAGKTFVTQFLANSKTDYQKYLEQFASDLHKRSLEKWNERVISFTTLLQNVG